MAKVARFVCAEMIEGDYLEFGVYRGDSLLEALLCIEKAFFDRIMTTVDNQALAERQSRLQLWNQMRFFAFDSFQGLPELEGPDAATRDFKPGQYTSSLPVLKERLARSGLRSDKVTVVEGWFEDTCTQESRMSYGIHKAAVVMIDADLYSSARTALDFVAPAICDGTVIIFDDWFSFRGNRSMGEQKHSTNGWRNIHTSMPSNFRARVPGGRVSLSM
ncbi:MAG: TylF/MycF/NovP-related O-methyltransferase [Gammaproteobacteria bacterium]|nr:TylF/MycF/NovP-related O-methyltransferase [Gammaproteobacteria bacterium]